MPHTHFQDFTRDDGSPVTVEYSFRGGSETSYSPLYGASGGDGCEVEIVSVMPNTPEYEELCRAYLDAPASASTQAREAMNAAKAAAALTDAENERMCAWLAEHHVDEPDDDGEF